MKNFLAAIGTLGLMAAGLAVYLIPSLPVAFATSTITTTVTGWNIPNGTTLSNGIVGFIIPIIVAGIFVGIPVGLGLRGQSVTFMLKLSLMAGCLITMLSLTSSNNLELAISFPIIAGIFFITYLWKGV